ncbi:MAG: hydroxymyristoyl-ACP dehydratase [Bacteroidales bacterium]
MTPTTLYTVNSICSNKNQYKVYIELNTLHPIYKGHFPGQPILPGACALQIIRECAGAILNRDIRYKTINQCKFIAMIIPNKGEIELLINIADDDILQAMVHLEGKTMLKLKSTFTNND